MSIKFNTRLFTWALGVIQPATLDETISFLRLLYPEVQHWPDKQRLESIKESLLKLNYITICNKKNGFYALTEHANINMEVKLKRSRDISRLRLLHQCYRASISLSDVVEQELVDDSSTTDTRYSTQEASRPITSRRESPFISSLTARSYWPRVTEQLESKVGLDNHPSDTQFTHRYYSFPNLASLKKASLGSSPDRDMSLSELALCIGVTPRLLSSFIHKPENHFL